MQIAINEGLTITVNPGDYVLAQTSDRFRGSVQGHVVQAYWLTPTVPVVTVMSKGSGEENVDPFTVVPLDPMSSSTELGVTSGA